MWSVFNEGILLTVRLELSIFILQYWSFHCFTLKYSKALTRNQNYKNKNWWLIDSNLICFEWGRNRTNLYYFIIIGAKSNHRIVTLKNTKTDEETLLEVSIMQTNQSRKCRRIILIIIMRRVCLIFCSCVFVLFTLIFFSFLLLSFIIFCSDSFDHSNLHVQKNKCDPGDAGFLLSEAVLRSDSARCVSGSWWEIKGCEESGESAAFHLFILFWHRERERERVLLILLVSLHLSAWAGGLSKLVIIRYWLVILLICLQCQRRRHRHRRSGGRDRRSRSL